jgi:hypothetical protein
MTPLEAANTGFVRTVGAGTRFFAGAGVLVFGLLMTGAAVASAVGLVTVVVVGPWEVLVWLTESHWPTTHFEAPAMGAILAVSGLAVAKASEALLACCQNARGSGRTASLSGTLRWLFSNTKPRREHVG